MCIEKITLSKCKQKPLIYLGGGNKPIESIVGGAMMSSVKM